MIDIVLLILAVIAHLSTVVFGVYGWIALGVIFLIAVL